MPKSEQKILLVDDEPRLLSALKRRLSDKFDVMTAESGAAAIRVIESGEPVGAILADMRMPGMDGIELLMEVERRWPDIRRLMLTGNTDQDTAMHAVNRGHVLRFFRKPCDSDELAAALGDALEEYRFLIGARAERCSLEFKAAAGEKTRKSFLSIMSHELLTPLNHVLGFTSILEMKLKNDNDDEALEYLAYVKEGGESLLRLLRRVLELSRLMSDDERRERELVDLGGVLKSEIDQMRVRAEEQSVSISFQMTQEPARVCVNEYELRLALRELLDNAIKFNRPQGHVSVAVSGSESWLTVRVADTGIGMSQDVLERAANLLHQGEECEVRRFGGVGLGLSFVMLFAKANSGAVGIESREGAGAAVTLTIPRARKEELHAASA